MVISLYNNIDYFPKIKTIERVIDNEYVLDIGLGAAIFIVVIF